MISIRNYLAILIMILIIFVMFMFTGVSSNILMETPINGHKDKVNIYYGDTITADSLNMDTEDTSFSGKGRTVFNREEKLQVAIFSQDSNNSDSQILKDWCLYNKYLYKDYDYLPDLEELAHYDVLLFGDYKITLEDFTTLYACTNLEKIMIFMELPDYQQISSNSDLASFFGIEAGIAESVTADGIKIFEDFMLSKERNYIKGDYFGDEDDTQISMPYYSLREGYEVYSVGILENQKELNIEDRNLPPLLWRTATNKSFVCVVNSEIFRDIQTLGVLTGFMANQREYYLYPVVNAQTISLIDYPYFSNENSEVLQQIYGRDAESVSRDLLWPNIIQILKNYGGSYNFFASSQLDYLDEMDPRNNYINFYLQGIAKLPGHMGLSLGQVSKADLQQIIDENKIFFKKYLTNYNLTSMYLGDFSITDLKSSMDDELMENVSLLMSDYKDGDSLMSFLNDDVLSVKFNLDGYEHETLDDLQMISIENALGMSNMKVDIGRVIYPEDGYDEWNDLSIKWSKGDTYFEDFKIFDFVSNDELEKRVRRFLALDYTYKYNQDYFDIYIDHFDEEAYFILSTNSSVINDVENGTAKKISDKMYLIKATDESVRIHITKKDVLEKPENIKTISIEQK